MPEKSLESQAAPDQAPSIGCTECPGGGFHERIYQFVRKNGILQLEVDPTAQLAESAKFGFGDVHRRLVELMHYSMQVDADTANWNGSLAATFLEYGQTKTDDSRKAKGESWEIQDDQYVLWKPTGISIKLDRGKRGSFELHVIAGYFRPIRSVVVEGWTYFDVEIAPGQRLVGSSDDLAKRLKRDGRIRKRKLGEDLLVEVLNHFAPVSGAAQAAYGLFERETGELVLCREPVPVRDAQLTAQEEILPGLQYTATLDDFQAYLRLLEFWHPYEVYPSMAMAAIAPVARVLRSHGVFVGHVWNYSLGHGLGKSTVQMAFSLKLWGRALDHASSLNSDFRIAALLDAASVPQTFDEAENLDLHRYGSLLKASAERPIVAHRGTTMLTMIPYSARTVLFLNGNRLVPTSGPALSRFFGVRFDAGRLDERLKRKPELDALIAQLRPVGHLLAETLEHQHPKIQSILERIRDLEAAFAKTGAPSGDIRRAQLWAVAYVGLEAWAGAIEALGGSWKPPGITEFAAEVIQTIEQHTFEGEETVVDAFRGWLEMYRARNVTRVSNTYAGGGRSGSDVLEHGEEIRGQGTVFLDETLVLGARRVPGTWVTRALIGEYNKQAAPDLRISSLNELAGHAADAAGIPREKVLDGRGQVKSIPFPRRGQTTADGSSARVRAAFIAREEGSSDE